MNTASEINPSVRNHIKIFIWLCFSTIFILIFYDILVRLFDIPHDDNLMFDLTFVFPESIVCFLLCTIALLMTHINPDHKSIRIITLINGTIVTAIAALNIFIYSAEAYTWVDLSFTENGFTGIFLGKGNRMEFMTTINFLILGIILLLYTQPSKKRLNLAHILVLLPLILSYVVILGHILDVYDDHVFLLISHSLATGIAFSGLCMIILGLAPNSWLMKIFTHKSSGSRMARVLLPGFVLTTLVIAWLSISGDRSGVFDSQVGVIFVATTYIIILVSLLWGAVYLVNRSEDELHASQDIYFTTLSSIGDAVIATDADGKIVFMNYVAEEITGWTFEESKSKPTESIFRIINEYTRLDEAGPLKTVLETGRKVVLTNHAILIRKDGKEIHIDDSCSPIRDKFGRITGAVLIFRDITERKKIENALRRSEETLRLAQKASSTGTWDWDMKDNSLLWTPDMFELFGLDPTKDKATFENWDKVLHPEDKQVAYARIETALKNHAYLDSTYRIILPGGKIKYIRATGEGRYDETGNPIRMLGICQDVTITRLAEEDLLLSETRYRSLFNSLIEGFCMIEMVFDDEGRPIDYMFLETNPAFEQQTGLTNIIGKYISEILPENEPFWYEFYGRVARTGIPESCENESKGLNKWYEVFAYKVGSDESSVVAILFNDISERKIIENQRRSETLRALALSEISKLFTEIPFDLSKIFDSFAKQIAEFIGDACIITRMSEDNEWLNPVAYYHPDPEAVVLMDFLIGKKPIKVGTGNAGKVAQTGQPLMVEGLPQEQIKAQLSPEYYPYLEKYGVYDYLIVPIKYEGKVMGTIGVLRVEPNKAYTSENQVFLESIAGRVALAISNSLLYDALQDSHDELEIKVLERTSQLNDALSILSREQKLFRNVLDMLPSYVALLTPDYHFSFTNKEFIRRFGNHKGNHCFKHLFEREAPCEICHTYEVFRTGKTVVWEWEGPDKCMYHIIDQPFTDADGTGLILEIGTDITMLKQAEFDRIGREVAEQANEAKSLFLANISHEIRTPMNAIIGFSDLLMMNTKDETQKSQIEVIRSSGKQLLGLINDILDLSKIEAGKMVIQPEPFTFSLFIDELGVLFSKKAEDKGLSLNINILNEIPPVLILDEHRLRQILNNLLDNAIKFTQDGHVTLTVNRKLKMDGRVDLIMSVEDTGIGIPHDQHELIFKAFNRQKGLSERIYQGTGLGLTITQRLLDLMGGSISLFSTPGEGSTFTIHLPDVSVQYGELDHKVHEKELDISNVLFQKSLVLIVDDNFENRKLLADLLESTSLDTIEASNGKEAVELALRTLPDLILMDLRMPEMSGYDATEILKSTESTKSIPVVAISASPKIITRGLSNKDMFDDFILKPANMIELVEVMKKYLSHRMVEKEAEIKSTSEKNKAMKLNEQQKSELTKLIATLEQDFLPIYHEVMADQLIGKIEDFSKKFASLTEKTKIGLLDDYSMALIKHTSDFDVEALMNTLRSFPNIVKKLKELSK